MIRQGMQLSTDFPPPFKRLGLALPVLAETRIAPLRVLSRSAVQLEILGILNHEGTLKNEWVESLASPRTLRTASNVTIRLIGVSSHPRQSLGLEGGAEGLREALSDLRDSELRCLALGSESSPKVGRAADTTASERSAALFSLRMRWR